MEPVTAPLVAANDRCIVSKATAFDRLLLDEVLDAAAAEGVSRLEDVDAAQLLAGQDVFLAFVDHQPIGCIMALRGNVTVLHTLFVIPPHRGQGHGCELIRFAISTIERNEERGDYWTAVDQEKPGASARFARFGFEAVPEFDEGRLQLMIRRRDQSGTLPVDMTASAIPAVRPRTARAG